MRELVRPVHKHIKDLFILDIKAVCDFADDFKYHIPDSLSESKFHATLGSIHKESSYGFIVREAFCSGEDVVLHGCEEEKHKGMQLLGALYIINMLSEQKSPNKTQTQWDLYNEAQKAVIHEHDNAK